MTSNVVLARALAECKARYDRVMGRILDRVEGNQVEYDSAAELREALALVDCLRRLVPMLSVDAIHKAFGAPGDFGYETPIGHALSVLYRGEDGRALPWQKPHDINSPEPPVNPADEVRK